MSEGFDVLVVDSYRARADERRRFSAPVVVAIDDLARDLAVDVLVDPSPGANRDRHTRARCVLAGGEYAIVDRRLAELSGPTGSVTRILVTLGASDQGAAAPVLGHALASCLPGVEIAVAVGPWSEPGPPDGIEIVATDRGLHDELARADLVVTAGGVTLLETLAAGRPCVALLLAANQAIAVDAIERAGAAIVSTVETLAEDVTTLVADPERAARLAARGRAVVDGRGADRVAEAIAAVSESR